MSINLMTKALYSSLPSTPKLVLVVLCDCANDDTLSCYPSVDTISKRSSLSRRQTQRTLHWLEDRGIVQVVKNPSGGKPGDTKHYQIITDKITQTGDTHDTGDNMTRVTSCPRRVTFATQTGDTHDTLTVNNLKTEPLLKDQSVSKKNKFDEFWSAYPVKRAKKKARDIWKRKKLDSMADAIIADVEKRQQDDKHWLDGFIPHPTTYLNGERWEDEITSADAERHGAGPAGIGEFPDD